MASRVFAQAGPSRIRNAPFRKSFSTSSSWRNASAGSETYHGSNEAKGETHYETLGIPQNASRMEIKAAYFRLSKRYHPDVRRSARPSAERAEGGMSGVDKQRKEKDADKRATEKFHEVNAAYRVLSDDRQRRAYDRSITSPSFIHRHRTPHAHAHTPGSSHSHAYTYELHSRRKRGATHAWENTGPRSYGGRSHTHTHPHGSAAGASSGLGAGRHYDPTSSPFTQYQSTAGNPSGSSTGPDTSSRQSERLSGRALRTEEEREAHDRIIRDSSVARFFRVLGIVLIVTWVGGLGKTLSG